MQVSRAHLPSYPRNHGVVEAFHCLMEDGCNIDTKIDWLYHSPFSTLRKMPQPIASNTASLRKKLLADNLYDAIGMPRTRKQRLTTLPRQINISEYSTVWHKHVSICSADRAVLIRMASRTLLPRIAELVQEVAYKQGIYCALGTPCPSFEVQKSLPSEID
jgi:hypothetical protein